MSKYRSPFGCPVTCTAGYPLYPSGKAHGGEDYVPTVKNETNWKLYAVDNATVYISKKQTGSYKGGYGAYGNYIVYQLSNGLWVLCAHLKSLPAVKAGQKISKGTYIGTAGETGNASGRHLHIEVSNMNGVKYDGATWYERFTEHRVKPSEYIDFSNYNPAPEGDDFEVKKWTNGSTREAVYATTSDCNNKRNQIGSIDARETANCYGIVDGCYIVGYNVSGTTSTKVGFVKYSGGVK